MIQSIQKIIKVGSSAAVTIPAKELKRQGLHAGDEVEVFVRPVSRMKDADDGVVIAEAKKILDEYKQDFKNLANR